MAVRLLLDAGADLNATNDDGETILHLCRNKAVIQFLLEEVKMDTDQATHRDGYTPLISSLSNMKVDNALRLLEFGVGAC